MTDLDARDYAERLYQSFEATCSALIEAHLEPQALGRILFYYLRGWSATEAVQFLIDAGADVNVRVHDGFARQPRLSGWGEIKLDGATPLTRAKTLARSQALVQAGARVDAERPPDGATSVHEAVRKGDVELVRFLVEQADGAWAFDKPDSGGRTPLRAAAAFAQIEAVRYLLAQGCDPNWNGEWVPWASSPLQLVVGYERWSYDEDQPQVPHQTRVEIAELLIEAGADPDLTISIGGSARYTAYQFGDAWLRVFDHYPTRRERRRGRGYRRGAVRRASRDRIEAFTQRLRESPYDAAPTLSHLDPKTLAEILCRYLQTDGDVADEVVRFLATAGADVNLRLDPHRPWEFRVWLDRPDNGSTALTLARNAAQVEALVAVGARVDQELPPNGKTSVHRAARDGDVERLRLLVGRAAGRFAFDKSDHSDFTPLLWAARQGHLEAVRYLLDQGADPNWTDMHCCSDTALNLATEYRHEPVAALLLNRGANRTERWRSHQS